MKHFVALIVILLTTTPIAAQLRAIISIDNQTRSEITTDCSGDRCVITVVCKVEDGEVCPLFICKGIVTNTIPVPIWGEKSKDKTYYDGCNTTTCNENGMCLTTLMHCPSQHLMNLLFKEKEK